MNNIHRSFLHRYVIRAIILFLIAAVITGGAPALARQIVAGVFSINNRMISRLGNLVPEAISDKVNPITGAVTEAPVANVDTYLTNEGTVLAVSVEQGVLNNDTDADGDTLTVASHTEPANGTLNINEDGSFVYTPNSGFHGSDSFTYDAFDAVTPSTTSVTITVNGLPLAVNDGDYQTAKNQSHTVLAPGVLGNDSDPEGGSLTAVKLSDPSHGTITLNASGSFTYTPNPGYAGSDSFTYKANDTLADSGSATVTIQVINTAPTASSNNYSTDRNQTLNVIAPGVLGNDQDGDGDTLTAILVSGVSHGTLALNADGSFTYTPAPDYAGADSFTYVANDGTENSNTATVSLTVVATNRPPVAVDNSYTTDRNQVLSHGIGNGVLSNDTDPDADQLTASLVSNVSHGVLSLNANGSFTYTPSLDYAGPDSFTYRAFDGQADSNVATVSITVNATNRAPTAADDTYTTDRNQALSTIVATGVLSNDTDPDGNSLTAILVNNVSHGSLTLNTDGSFTYTPATDYAGPDSFTYRATDGAAESNTATVNITVNATNRPPTAAGDNYTMDQRMTLSISAPGVLANDTDLDANPLAAVLVSDVASDNTLVLNGDGSFTYTPAAAFSGTDSFTYYASDGTAVSNTVTVQITVNYVNRAPIAGNDAYTMDPNTTLTVAAIDGVLKNDSDPDGNAVTAVPATGPSHGTLSAFNPDGSFTYTPAAGFTGQDTFTYRATDGELLSPVATVAITVINHQPTAANDTYTAYSGQTLTIAAPGLLTNDSDPDGNTLTTVRKQGPSHGNLTLNSNGSFSYTPVSTFIGIDTFTYAAFDGQTESNIATVTLNVLTPNTTPVAYNDQFLTNKPLNIAAPGVLGNDVKALYTQGMVAILVTGTSNGQLTFNTNGAFSYTPNPGFNGFDTFTYKVKDGEMESSVATVTIEVDVTPPSAPVWVLPVTSGGVYISEGEEVAIETVSGASEPISRMQFLWWDAKAEEPAYRSLATLTQGPYQFVLDTSTLNVGWNQIFVICYDQAGNPSGTQFIWIIRGERQVMYLPMVLRK